MAKRRLSLSHGLRQMTKDKSRWRRPASKSHLAPGNILGGRILSVRYADELARGIHDGAGRDLGGSKLLGERSLDNPLGRECAPFSCTRVKGGEVFCAERFDPFPELLADA